MGGDKGAESGIREEEPSQYGQAMIGARNRNGDGS